MKRETPKERDIRLWHAYNDNPSQMTLTPLMKSLEPLIQSQVSKWHGAVARPVLEARARVLALEAIKSFDPSMGNALSTHVTNRLQKLSRTVYTHQDAVRVPEHRKLKVMAYMRAQQELMDVNGREPSSDELRDHLRWSPKMLQVVESSMGSELVESEDVGAGLFETTSIWDQNTNDAMVDMIVFDLPPDEKMIYEHTTGYGGKPILSNTELAAKLGINQSQLSYKKRKLVEKIKTLTD